MKPDEEKREIPEAGERQDEELLTQALEAAARKKQKNRRRMIAAAAAVILLIAGCLALTKYFIPEYKYRSGVALMQEEKYQEAAAFFTEIRGYKDVDSLIESNAVLGREAMLKPFRTVGSTVTFGFYPQTESGEDMTPIEWIVLDTKENRSLLISKYGLDAGSYHSNRDDVTWETCALRAWLNGEFMQKAFSEKEQTGILTTEVDNSSASRGGSGQDENNTQDKVFLLSYEEAHRYFGSDYNDASNHSRIVPTEYARKNGALSYNSYKTEDGILAGYWWLRSTGGVRSYPTLVFPDGSLYHNYDNVIKLVIRPVLWLDLEADFL